MFFLRAATFNILRSFKNSRNLLINFKEIRWYNLQELLLGIKKCILTSIVALEMQSERNTPKKRTNSWFLPHDNAPAHRSVSVKDFLAQNNVTTLQHPLNLLPWLQLIFTCSFDWNRHWKSGALWCYWQRYECDGRPDKTFANWLPWIFPKL